MFPDEPVPLATESPGCALETKTRAIQNGTETYNVSLNREWLAQLGLREQGAATVHAVATHPVIVTHPAIIIQPAEVLDP